MMDVDIYKEKPFWIPKWLWEVGYAYTILPLEIQFLVLDALVRDLERHHER